MKTTISHYVKCGFKSACLLAGIAAFGLSVASAESENLIVNPSFILANGKIAPWGQKVAGSLESHSNPADSAQCGKIIFTSIDPAKNEAKSNIYQCLKILTPGTYILSFSCSGEDLSSIYVVVRFQKEPGIVPETVLGQYVKNILARELPDKDEWKDFALSFIVPEGTEAGTVFFEPFGGPDMSTGFALLKNVKLVKQDE